jgi:DNA polymerase III delta prime subunit
MIPELYCGGGARTQVRLRARELLPGLGEAHPDFLRLEAEGRWLGINEVRSLILWARYAPVSGAQRVAVVGPAERLTPEAANALLKLLEEVPPYLAPLLYAESADRVLPTLRSRCALRLVPTPAEAWAEALGRAGYAPSEVAFLLDLCAEREEELGSFLETKRDVFSELKEAEAEAQGLPLSELFLRFCGEAADPLRRRTLAHAIFAKLLEAQTFSVLQAAESLAHTGAMRHFLWELLRLLRDGLVKRDLAGPRARWAAWAKKVSLARAELEANANPRLLAEVVLLWPRMA